MNIEQVVAEKFKVLGPNQQQDVLAFIELLQSQVIALPTSGELRQADAIIARGIARAQGIVPQTPELIWQRFDAIRQRLANHSASQ
ncbi:hypothetical protein IQ265_26870 [Nodosilinea sp. LEGE 06152]|uniref:hypothetical protein n=1 Tax=Nodosilinea sp. LEGE 06152 TaxID=2777966 RepID=UPI001880C8A6|nr:hypothetical protein [Nodosilinea sp. LEGE 06152]MBE9158475.1 hypothetical protein [Nodosilinea sp. LEGE 06152]MBE9160417.1 hypothetical protein [Nodosilinea sp. LEGE 06152]